MTDDRARRIREMRNRGKSTGESEDEADDSPDEPESATDSNEESEPERSESESEPEADDAGSDEEASEETDEEPTESNEPESEGETVSYDETEDVDGVEDTTSDETTTETDSTSDDTDETADSTPSTASTDEDSGPETEAEPVAESDEFDGLDPALRGAIAGTSVEGSIGDDEVTVDASVIGEGGGTYGDAAIGRGKEVLERGDSLIASTHNEEDTIQMLEFYLEDSRYAIEIDRISAIVEMKDITRFPRGPEAIDGVTDLRGEITGVLDPTALLDVERNELSDDHYIVVIERADDKQKLGVRVSDVSQAVTYRESQIDETAAAMDDSVETHHEFVEGIIKKTKDDGTTLVTWLDIDGIIESVSAERTVASVDA
ncbi:chemotaxis protein CheW [Natronobacterium texcoconense]|uniref:Purine-binding chemotaxis protein CheW n=1 Tax=Natronobacterium texcoconense TaxID=1095778 RepID=A0A1H1IKV2_NATTX|nr:chemotaxis protein CheW [Natronobacterium texcoconense]SDR38209.1 purine-binding chemotaxis protein CheW [Natronobacterium texcoconense]